MIRVKEESEKAVLKLNIHKTKIMASGPITSWQIDGGKVEAVSFHFLFSWAPNILFSWAPKSLDQDCSHKIQRCLLLGRKAMTNLDSVLKSRDITLPTKAYIIKVMVFPIVMYRCKSWTIKKTEH